MKMLINGQWVDAILKGTIPVYNPSTHELIDHVPLGTKEDIFKAVEYAKAGYKINRSIPAKVRYEYLVKAGNLLLDNLEELRETMILENGKPWYWADFEVKKSAEILINIGFANALPVAENAMTYGASRINASLAAWMVVLIGAVSFNMLYSIVLLTKNKTWGTFALPKIGNAVKWAVVAAVLWFGSLGVYGLGAAKMGTLGTVIGWPVFVGLSLIFSNFWAIRAGEWKGMKKPMNIMFAGIAILMAATVILAYANSMNVE